MPFTSGTSLHGTMRFTFKLAPFSVLISLVCALALPKNPPPVSSMVEVNAFWTSMDTIANRANDRLAEIASHVEQLSENGTTFAASTCYRAIEKTLRSGIRREWSSKLINSNAFTDWNFFSNLMSEEYSSLGNFDQCVEVGNVQMQALSALEEGTQLMPFSGKYCLVNLTTPQLAFYSESAENRLFANISTDTFHQHARRWLSVRNRYPILVGICVPSVCREVQVKELIDNYFTEYLHGIQVTVDYCQVKNVRPDLDPVPVGYLISKYFLTSLFFISIFASTLHSQLFTDTKPNSRSSKLLHALTSFFSIPANIRTLFSPSSGSTELRFIHGIKSALMLSILCTHTLTHFAILYINRVSFFIGLPSFTKQIIPDSTSAYSLSFQPDTVPILISSFFILSGFLSTHTILTKFQSTPPIVAYITHRYFNLLPSVLGTLSLTILFQKVGSGPLFHTKLTDTYVKPCHDFWWTHVLFINNFYTIDQMCGPNLWFIAANFQLYLLLFPVICAYYRKRIFAYIGSIAFASFAAIYLISLTGLGISGMPNELYPHQFRFPIPFDAIRLVYTSPISHLFAYFMGVICALYVIDCKKNLYYVTTKFYNLATFLVFTAIGLFASLPIAGLVKSEENEHTNLEYIVLMTATLLLFVLLSCAWLLFTYLVKADQSRLKCLLEHPAAVVISRLAYGLYLLNAIPIWFNVHNQRQTPILSWQYLFNTSLMNICQTFLLAIFVYLFIETPFKKLNLWLFTHN